MSQVFHQAVATLNFSATGQEQQATPASKRFADRSTTPRIDGRSLAEAADGSSNGREVDAVAKDGRHLAGVARWLLVLVLALVFGGAGSAFAAPCAGFVDVDSAGGYCGNVEWMKNRAITLGCTSSQYCPDDPVSRLQMAAFMNRLGKALQPVFLYKHELVPSFPGLGETILCQVGSAAADFPRVATPAGVSVDLSSPGAAAAFAGLVVSFDNGATWTNWSNTLSVYPSNAAGVSSSQSPAAPPLAVAAGQTVRFGVQPFKAAGGPNIDEAVCELSVRLESGG